MQRSRGGGKGARGSVGCDGRARLVGVSVMDGMDVSRRGRRGSCWCGLQPRAGGGHAHSTANPCSTPPSLCCAAVLHSCNNSCGSLPGLFWNHRGTGSGGLEKGASLHRGVWWGVGVLSAQQKNGMDACRRRCKGSPGVHSWSRPCRDTTDAKHHLAGGETWVGVGCLGSEVECESAVICPYRCKLQPPGVALAAALDCNPHMFADMVAGHRAVGSMSGQRGTQTAGHTDRDKGSGSCSGGMDRAWQTRTRDTPPNAWRFRNPFHRDRCSGPGARRVWRSGPASPGVQRSCERLSVTHGRTRHLESGISWGLFPSPVRDTCQALLVRS